MQGNQFSAALFSACAITQGKVSMRVRGSLDPRPFWLHEEGSGGIILPESVLLECHSFQLHFQIFNAIGQYYSNFQNFYVLPYIHFLSSVELEHWLAEMRSFPHQYRWRHSSAQDTSGQSYSPDPSSRGQKGLGSRLGQGYRQLED